MKTHHSTPRYPLLDSYNLFLVVYLILRVVGGTRWWWLNLLHTFAFWLFVPLIGVIVLAVLLRQRRVALSALLLFVFGMLQFAPLPVGLITQSDQPHDLRVLTFNVWGDNQRIGDAIDWVLAQDADVLILEELIQTHQATQLPRLLEAYPHHVFVDGNVRIFSRHPFIDSGLIWLEDPSAYRDGRLAVRAEIDFNGQPITVYGVHLTLPVGATQHGNLTTGIDTLDFILRYDETIRNGQLQNLAERVASETNPVIVAGDFNTSHTSPVLQKLTQVGLTDAFKAVGRGWGMTWTHMPSEFPVLRIDYVWSSDALEPLRYHRDALHGSDHHPIIVDYRLTQ